jgi:hypothetical protein
MCEWSHQRVRPDTEPLLLHPPCCQGEGTGHGAQQRGEQQVVQQTTDTSVRPVIVRTDVVPAIAVRVTGALLALAVATVHVADQGGITALAPPSWIGC